MNRKEIEAYVSSKNSNYLQGAEPAQMFAKIWAFHILVQTLIRFR